MGELRVALVCCQVCKIPECLDKSSGTFQRQRPHKRCLGLNKGPLRVTTGSQSLLEVLLFPGPLASVFVDIFHAQWCKVRTPANSCSTGWRESNKGYWFVQVRFPYTSSSRLPPWGEMAQSMNANLLLCKSTFVEMMLSTAALMCFGNATSLQVLIFYIQVPST